MEQRHSQGHLVQLLGTGTRQRLLFLGLHTQKGRGAWYVPCGLHAPTVRALLRGVRKDASTDGRPSSIWNQSCRAGKAQTVTEMTGVQGLQTRGHAPLLCLD